MKTLILFLIVLCTSFFAKGQGTGYPITQNLGSGTTLVRVPPNGGFQASLINRTFTDTTAANLTPIDFYPGAMIFTSSDNAIWYRNSTATEWIKFASSSNSPPPSYVTIINDSSISICNVNSCDTFVVNVTAQTIQILNDSTVVVCSYGGSCDTININPTPLIPSNKFVDSISVSSSANVDSFFYYKGGDTTLWHISDRECGAIDQFVVTYDSLLKFTISPTTTGAYRLCCDGVRRTASLTTVTLNAADPTNPRYDAIVLDSTGIVVVTGTAAANPATPTLDNCQILLTNILVGAGETSIPCDTSGITIYDENTGAPEWTPTASGVTVNYNGVVPYHLTKSATAGAFTSGQYLNFAAPTGITLSAYTYVRFFVRLNTSWNNNTYMQVSWVNTSGSFSSVTVNIQNGSYGFSRTTTGTYQTITIPISSWGSFGTGFLSNLSFRITLFGNNSGGFNVDWIQLGGACINQPSGATGVASVSSGNLPPLFTTTVTNPNTTPIINYFLTNAAAGTVFGNNATTTGAPSYSANPVIGRTGTTGTLGFRGLTSGTVTIQPQAAAGTFNFNLPITAGTSGYLLTSGGGGATAMTWTDPATLASTGANPTASVGLTAVNGVATTFMRSDAAPPIDQSIAPTWTGIHTFNNKLLMLDGRMQWDKGANVAAANDLTLGTDGNLFTITGNTQINAITTANWQAGSEIAMIFTGTPTLKNNTAGGAGTATMLLAGRVDYTAAAGDYIAFIYDGTNWYETQRKLAATGGVYTFNNGLTESPAGTVGLRGTLNQTTTINTAGFATTWTGANTGTVFQATTSSSGNGIGGTSNSGTGGSFTSTSGSAVVALTTSGTAVSAQSSSSLAGNFLSNPATTNTVHEVMRFRRASSGTAADGVGLSLGLYSQSDNGQVRLATEIVSKWTTAADATRVSQSKITGVNAAVTGDIISFEGNKRTMLYGRLEMQQGADVASVAGAIAVGLDGNVFELTGTNAVTLISNENFVNGSIIYLLFTSTATLTDGTANSGTDIGMELLGNANFVGSADDVVCLVLSEIGGTQRWRMVSSSVN